MGEGHCSKRVPGKPSGFGYRRSSDANFCKSSQKIKLTFTVLCASHPLALSKISIPYRLRGIFCTLTSPSPPAFFLLVVWRVFCYLMPKLKPLCPFHLPIREEYSMDV